MPWTMQHMGRAAMLPRHHSLHHHLSSCNACMLIYVGFLVDHVLFTLSYLFAASALSVSVHLCCIHGMRAYICLLTKTLCPTVHSDVMDQNISNPEGCLK